MTQNCNNSVWKDKPERKPALVIHPVKWHHEPTEWEDFRQTVVKYGSIIFWMQIGCVYSAVVGFFVHDNCVTCAVANLLSLIFAVITVLTIAVVKHYKHVRKTKR